MILDKPGLDKEFRILLGNKEAATMWNYTADLLINGQKYPLPKVNYVNIDREFAATPGDVIMIGVSIDLRLYENMLLTNARNFDVILTRRLVTASAVEKAADTKYFRQYHGHLETIPDTKMTKNTRDGNKGKEEALGGLIEINIQLIEETIDEMKNLRMGGVSRDNSLKDILCYFLSYKLSDIEIKEQLLLPEHRYVRGVDIVPPTNTDPTPVILIPSDMPVLEFPQWLQRTVGVYASGIGYYFQEGWWHVYPLYNTRRFSQVKKTLTVLCVPKEELPTSEKTFLYRSEQLYVFSTGERVITDLSEQVGHQDAQAVRFYNTDDLVDGMFTVTGNKAIPDPSKTKREVTLRGRSDKRYNTKLLKGTFTSNSYKITSKLISTIGRYLTTTWVNCDYSLLYPGMPTKVQYVEGNDLVEVMGVLHAVNISINKSSELHTDPKFITTAILTIYIEEDAKRSD